MIIPKGFVWSPQEAASINDFLNSQLGKKWLDLLYFQRPRTAIDKGIESAALSGAFASGYESIFGQIALSRSTLSTEEVAVSKPIDMIKD